jgi:ABC-2 type transport system permease protein
MRNVWTIAKREFNLYIISPIAYVVALIILLILGIIFYANMSSAVAALQSGQNYVPTVQVIVGPLVTLFLFTTPAVTMRTISDEQRMGTLETLLTAPVQDWELVVGKWLGSFLFFFAIIALTWIFPIVLNIFVKPGIDQGLLISGYLGVLFLVSAFIAIGVFASSLFSNQIAAFFATLGILLVLWMISYPSQAAPGGASQILTYLDLSEHYYNTFLRGIVELKDIIYYLSVTVLALFLGTMSVEARRWR